VSKGEVVVVCGPSGSGKSTLIRCVNGLEKFQDGSLTVNGVSPAREASGSSAWSWALSSSSSIFTPTRPRSKT
jgi:ABC-type polar amino acid transport system ATPase subunit